MTTLKCIPGFIWALPSSLLGWVFFCLPNLCVGTFFDVWIDKHLCITWGVNRYSDFYRNKMEGWYGFVLGCNRVVVDTEVYSDDHRNMKHEFRHVLQNYVLGIFFYPLYILMTCFIWLFLKDKHAYLDNPFERDARKFAGQRVDISKEDWPEGEYDRWPWW